MKSSIVQEHCFGDPLSPTIFVLIHGFGANSSWWSKAIKEFQEYQIYALDLSFRRPIATIAQEILEWLQKKHLQRVTLVAHSLGSQIALWIAAGSPERVAQLILVNPSLPQPNVTVLQWLLRCRQARKISTNPPAKVPFSLWCKQMHPGAWRMVLYALRQPFKRGNVAISMLIIWGTKDPLFPLQYAEWYQQQFPCARLVCMDAGHCIMHERASEFIELVRLFSP